MGIRPSAHLREKGRGRAGGQPTGRAGNLTRGLLHALRGGKAAGCFRGRGLPREEKRNFPGSQAQELSLEPRLALLPGTLLGAGTFPLEHEAACALDI